jgi:hypothetical protein
MQSLALLQCCVVTVAIGLPCGCAAGALNRSDAEVLAELPPDIQAIEEKYSIAPSPPARNEQISELLERGRAAAEHAALTLAPEDIAAAECALDDALALAPRSSWAHYQRAFAAQARMLAWLHGGDRAGAGDFGAAASEAVHHARVALALTRERPAEAAALLSSIQGLRIAQNWWLGMSLGSECDTLLELAEHADAENPRVDLVRGIELWNKPALFGGDRDAARARFARARESFAREARAPGAGEPGWGPAEACAWHGLALIKQGELAQAREALEQALVIAPEYAWVDVVLLPALEAREQKR